MLDKLCPHTSRFHDLQLHILESDNTCFLLIGDAGAVGVAASRRALPRNGRSSPRLFVGGLDLETLRRPSSSTLLELPALGSDVRLSTLEGTTEVPDGSVARRNISASWRTRTHPSSTDSRAFLLPRIRTVLEPVGARRASWSRVKASPPLATIRSRADRVNRKAATESLGTTGRRSSSRTVPTITTVLDPWIRESVC
jgi:hypothetical protein